MNLQFKGFAALIVLFSSAAMAVVILHKVSTYRNIIYQVLNGFIECLIPAKQKENGFNVVH